MILLIKPEQLPMDQYRFIAINADFKVEKLFLLWRIPGLT